MPGTSMTREPRVVRSPLFPLWTDPFRSLREEMQNLLSDLYGARRDGSQAKQLIPSLDLYETGDAVQIRIDIPGMKAEEIDIQLNQGVLTVAGHRNEEKVEEGRTFHRLERRTGEFFRSLKLPAAVKEEAVDARYQDGILTITLQKTEAAKSHKIKVKL